MSFDRASHDHEPAGVLIEPMHDAGAGHQGQLGVEVQQRILQSAGGVARAWMNDQPGGLVDHQDMLVLMHDIQADLLGLDADLVRQRGADLDALPAQHLVLGAQLGAVHPTWPASIHSLIRVRE